MRSAASIKIRPDGIVTDLNDKVIQMPTSIEKLSRQKIKEVFDKDITDIRAQQLNENDSIAKKMVFLPEKITSLPKLIQRLNETQKHLTKKRIFSLLRSLLYVAIVTGGILGTIAVGVTNPLVLIVALGTVLSMVLLGINYHKRVFPNSTPIPLPVIDAFLPFFEDCWNLNSLRKKITENKTKIEKSFTEITRFSTKYKTQVQAVCDQQKTADNLKLNEIVKHYAQLARENQELNLRIKEGSLSSGKESSFSPSDFRVIALNALTLGEGTPSITLENSIYHLLGDILSDFSDRTQINTCKETIEKLKAPHPILKFSSKWLSDKIHKYKYIKEKVSFFRQQLTLLKEGKLVFLQASWDGHAVYLVAYRGYLFICNRGKCRQASSIVGYKIDPSCFYWELLMDIFLNFQANSDAGSKFIYEDLPERLKGEKDELVSEIEKQANHKEQKVGNCGWTQPKLAVVLAMALEKYFNSSELEKTNFSFEDEFQRTGKTFTAFTRLWFFEMLTNKNLIQDIIQSRGSGDSKKYRKKMLAMFLKNLIKMRALSKEVPLKISEILAEICKELSPQELIAEYERKKQFLEADILRKFLLKV